MGGSRQGDDRSTCGQHEATIRLGNGGRTGGLQGGSVVVVVVVATICSQCLFNHLKTIFSPAIDRSWGFARSFTNCSYLLPVSLAARRPGQSAAAVCLFRRQLC